MRLEQTQSSVATHAFQKLQKPALALLALATDWLAKRGFLPRILRWSEVEELFFAYGWLIYSTMLLGRVRSPRWAASV
jgi:hypothetical protein